jgi:hypothetical protein
VGTSGAAKLFLYGSSPCGSTHLRQLRAGGSVLAQEALQLHRLLRLPVQGGTRPRQPPAQLPRAPPSCGTALQGGRGMLRGGCNGRQDGSSSPAGLRTAAADAAGLGFRGSPRHLQQLIIHGPQGGALRKQRKPQLLQPASHKHTQSLHLPDKGASKGAGWDGGGGRAVDMLCQPPQQGVAVGMAAWPIHSLQLCKQGVVAYVAVLVL